MRSNPDHYRTRIVLCVVCWRIFGGDSFGPPTVCSRRCALQVLTWSHGRLMAAANEAYEAAFAAGRST